MSMYTHGYYIAFNTILREICLIDIKIFGPQIQKLWIKMEKYKHIHFNYHTPNVGRLN